MGEIAEALIWGEMNGIDMNDNSEAWVTYYNEMLEEEERKRKNRRQSQNNSKKYRQPLLDRGGKQIPNTPIIELGNWLCYYKNGYARDRYRHWIKTSLDNLLGEKIDDTKNI